MQVKISHIDTSRIENSVNKGKVEDKELYKLSVRITDWQTDSRNRSTD
jgi:hypothetical protein